MKKLIIILIVVAFLAASCSERLCPAYTNQGQWEIPAKPLKK
jgi:hypothetical protein